MRSIAFPNIFSNLNTNLISDKEATMSNLRLLLLSDRGSLFGDPYFGSSLKRLLFDQNNEVLKDIVIDDIYTSILTFLPQIILERKDITIIQNKKDVYINIKATNLLDYVQNTYVINLTGSGE